MLWPFRQFKVVALRNFEAKDVEQLSIIEEQKLILISKHGYREGWWKVRSQNEEVSFVSGYSTSTLKSQIAQNIVLYCIISNLWFKLAYLLYSFNIQWNKSRPNLVTWELHIYCALSYSDVINKTSYSKL